MAPGVKTERGIHYQLRGDLSAPRGLAVLLHGIGDSAITWDPLALSLVADGYRVLTLDFLGRGWSSMCDEEDCSLECHLRQMREVLHVCGLSKTPHVVVCHSMGSIVGVAHCVDPQGISTALVLIAPAGALKKHPVQGLKKFLQGACCCCLRCCCIPWIAKLLSGDPPIDNDYDRPTKLRQPPESWLAAGAERSEWSLSWHRTFGKQRGAGHPALVMSALRMPFCTVADEVRDMYGIEAGMTASRIRVLVYTALSDPACGTATVDMNKYVQLFPHACVEEEVATRGKHCFHVQDAENVQPKILDWLNRMP